MPVFAGSSRIKDQGLLITSAFLKLMDFCLVQIFYFAFRLLFIKFRWQTNYKSTLNTEMDSCTYKFGTFQNPKN